MVPAVPTFVATVEFRGRRDVTHAMARQDAQALLDFLAERGMLADAAPPIAARSCEPAPLAGMEIIKAPEAGVLTFVRELGERLCAGDAVAEVIDRTTGRVTVLRSTVAGVLFARDDARYAYHGMNVAFVAGAEPIRSGALLTA
ncbi:succinylglutamate desuccinylase/aspartoacylase family protein [Paraburkholderia sediminicola]|uniref:succinylglutamate desuccinylase/aspartoacylase family protein n=1 Tax=Paraburkholderia sediminicola TaxID=458836 RepID=UPI0038BA6EEA